MQSKVIVDRLRPFAEGRGQSKRETRWIGQQSFAAFLIDYFTKILDIPQEKKYESWWDIEPYLPQVLSDAFEHLRTGNDELTKKHRVAYEAETGHAVPNILELGASDPLQQGGAVQTTLGFMFSKIIDCERIQDRIDAYCNAQKHVLQQTFDKFLRLVYRRGLYEIIKDDRERGMGGEFGKTKLRSYSISGRLMFTFARKATSEEEETVSFVAEEDDRNAWSAGLQSVYADLPTAMSMIEDVIMHWPADSAKQKKVFCGNKKIQLDAVAAMMASENRKK